MISELKERLTAVEGEIEELKKEPPTNPPTNPPPLAPGTFRNIFFKSIPQTMFVFLYFYI